MNNAMKKMMALLLAIVMVLLASPFAVLAEGLIEEELNEVVLDETTEIAPAINVSNAVTAANLLDKTTDEERTVTASAGGLEFSVTGRLTETTTLNVQALGGDVADYIRDTVLGLDEQTVGTAYDITLYDNGVEIQPDETVEVSIGGMTAADSVYHLPHTSAADVRGLAAQALAAAENAVRKVAGSVPKHERVDFRQEGGKLKFKTNGFSVYYIANGIWSCDVEGKTTWNSNEDTIYMAPGTSATITVDDDYSYTAISDKDWIIPKAPENGNDKVTITVTKEAPINGTGIVTLYIGDYVAGSVTIVVLSAEDAEAGFKAQIQEKIETHQLWIAVRADGTIPPEPSDQSEYKYYYYKSNGTVANGNYANSASGYISTDIVNHERFSTSTDGSPTVGLYDGDGSDTLAVLTATINFDDFLYEVAGKGDAKASDGKIITRNNYQEYRIIPYVVKLQEMNGHGWHIDCVIVPRNVVTLQYDSNIPAGFTTTTNIYMPNSEAGPAPATFKIGSIRGLTNNQVKVTDGTGEYTFTFLGWNTEPTGQGEWYYPESFTEEPHDITINEDTTLYAIWNSNPAIGTGDLQITKQVEGTVTGDEIFEFTVTLKDKDGNLLTGSYNYKIIASNGVEVPNSSDTINNGGKISLKATQHATIFSIPDKAKVTITENAPGYTPSWDIGSVEGSTSSTVEIKGGATTQVICTNTPVPQTTSVTATKVWVDNNNSYGTRPESISLQLMANGVASGEAVTVTLDATTGAGTYTWSDLPINDADGDEITYTVTEVNVPYGYTASYSEDGLTVTNTLNTHKLTVKKTVSGNMGDQSKEFAFTVNYGGEARATDSLHHEETMVVDAVVVGATVSISEVTGGYDYSVISVKTASDTDVIYTALTELAAGSEGLTFTMPDADVTVIINNEKVADVDTGILLDTLPYVVILALVVAAGVLWFIRKRRVDD